MTQDEAVARWRKLSREEAEAEKKANPEFRAALFAAAAAGNRYWEVDAAGCHKKQYGAGVSPTRPNTKDYREYSLRELAPENRPLKDSAFPS